jgi:hypothetical protein
VEPAFVAQEKRSPVPWLLGFLILGAMITAGVFLAVKTVQSEPVAESEPRAPATAAEEAVGVVASPVELPPDEPESATVERPVVPKEPPEQPTADPADRAPEAAAQPQPPKTPAKRKRRRVATGGVKPRVTSFTAGDLFSRDVLREKFDATQGALAACYVANQYCPESHEHMGFILVVNGAGAIVGVKRRGTKARCVPLDTCVRTALKGAKLGKPLHRRGGTIPILVSARLPGK